LNPSPAVVSRAVGNSNHDTSGQKDWSGSNFARFEPGRILKPFAALKLLRKTGAKAQAFEIPFKAIENLLDLGVSFHAAAMSADPRIMDERESLILRLAGTEAKLALNLEEEVVDPYKTTLARLEYAGVKLKWPLRQIYSPVKLPRDGEFLRRRLGTYSYWTCHSTLRVRHRSARGDGTRRRHPNCSRATAPMLGIRGSLKRKEYWRP